MALIDITKRRVIDHQWGIDAVMINGSAVIEEPQITENSRVKAFPRDGGVTGALHPVLSPNIGFTIVSSNGADSGDIYCEVIL